MYHIMLRRQRRKQVQKDCNYHGLDCDVPGDLPPLCLLLFFVMISITKRLCHKKTVLVFYFAFYWL